jgi:1-acyl-sn-glycerol-3-phosphate acyltransferase
MGKPYKAPVVKASPNIRVPEPRISPFVIFLAKIFGRLYLLLYLGIARMVLQGEQSLFEAFKRALAGKSRCIIAFRHPNGGEPQLLGIFFLFKLRILAARAGVKFARRPHAVFVYGYEVIRWGGWVARFVMPNVGAMPIYHSKIDSKSMTRIYKAITEGPYPVALAPEGHVSYATDAVRRLEPGVVRIGFHAAKQLAEEGSDLPIEILPVSVHFRFGSWGKINMEILLKRIEKITGRVARGRKKLPFVQRVSDCRQYLLELNESRFQIEGDDVHSFEYRLERVTYAALETAERMMGEKSEGDFFARMYKLRQIYWDKIVLPDFDSLDDMTYAQRNVLNLQAGESWYIGRYLDLIDFTWYFRIPVPAEDAAFHTKLEYVQNLWDFANRTMGGGFPERFNIFPRKVVIKAAPVINLSERLKAYRNDKKTVFEQTMSDLEKAYLDCIDEMNHSDVQA